MNLKMLSDEMEFATTYTPRCNYVKLQFYKSKYMDDVLNTPKCTSKIICTKKGKEVTRKACWKCFCEGSNE